MCKQAAELGDVQAQYRFGLAGFGENDSNRYLWVGKAAVMGVFAASQHIVEALEQQLKLFDEGGSGCVLYEMGAALSGHVDPLHRQVLNIHN